MKVKYGIGIVMNRSRKFIDKHGIFYSYYKLSNIMKDVPHSMGYSSLVGQDNGNRFIEFKETINHVFR